MPSEVSELALLEEVCSLPAQMQKIYLRLVSAIDQSIQQLSNAGATSELISEAFIEQMVDEMLDHSLTDKELRAKIQQEFHRQILESSGLTSAYS